MLSSDKASDSPLVLKVRDHVVHQLEQLYPGDRVPSETRIANDCGVSRTTVRRVLQSLEDEGIITRRKTIRTLQRSIQESDKVDLPPDPLPKDQEVARWLLSQIGHGNIRPGQNISERSIARQLGCSYTPVREALLALSPLGFFDKSDRRQWQALSLNPKLIHELCELRLLIESYGLRKLMHPGVLARHRPRLEELRVKTNQLRSPENYDVTQLLKTDIALHQLLLQAPGNQLMIERHQYIYAMIQFQLQNAQFTIDRVQLGLDQHLQILDAILDQDEAAAFEQLETHLLSAEQTLLMLKPEPPL